MSNVLLHPTTEASITSFLKDPSHAVCLIGPAGAGKRFLARHVCAALLGEHGEDALHIVKPEKNSIGIDQIRQLHHFLRLKKAGDQSIKRVVIIEHAETMGEEAQNALLKMLEEPPLDTVFILTSEGTTSLKPTIVSRVQKLLVLPVSLKQAQRFFSNSDLQKLYSLSGGYVGLLHNLVENKDHELVQAVETAKQLLKASGFQRLLLVDEIAKNKQTTLGLLHALERVIEAAITNKPAPQQLKRLTSGQRAIYDARVDLEKNVNSKLLLSDLFLTI